MATKRSSTNPFEQTFEVRFTREQRAGIRAASRLGSALSLTATRHVDELLRAELARQAAPKAVS